MNKVNGSIVRIDPEAKDMLEKMADAENRNLANMASTLIKRAYVSIPVVGSIENGQIVFNQKTVVAAASQGNAKVDPRIIHDSTVPTVS